MLGTALFVYSLLYTLVNALFLHTDFISAFTEIWSFIYGSIISSAAYLLGANISRGVQFGRWRLGSILTYISIITLFFFLI